MICPQENCIGSMSVTKSPELIENSLRRERTCVICGHREITYETFLKFPQGVMVHGPKGEANADTR